MYWKVSKEDFLLDVLHSLLFIFILPHTWNSFGWSSQNLMIKLWKSFGSNPFSHPYFFQTLRILVDPNIIYIQFIYSLYIVYMCTGKFQKRIFYWKYYIHCFLFSFYHAHGIRLGGIHSIWWYNFEKVWDQIHIAIHTFFKLYKNFSWPKYNLYTIYI